LLGIAARALPCGKNARLVFPQGSGASKQIEAGDRSAPQLIGSDEEIKAFPLPVLKGSFFNLVGGSGFQRPIELATLRLRNMSEVLSHWRTYVPNADFLTQRGGTFLIDNQGQVLYEHRDRGILGFAENMSRPLSFLTQYIDIKFSID
jgi:hypothetical protein